MAENLDPYWYRPLIAQHGGLRIAILQPAVDFLAPVYCDLIEATLSNHPEYETISYVWGDPNKQASLRIEGADLKVTVNLELAIRYLRLPHGPRNIWADAICIDQNNLEERSLQVQLMKDIYSTATRDLVWLGEGNQYTKRGIDSLTRMKPLATHRSSGTLEFSRRTVLKDLGIDSTQDVLGIKSIISKPGLWKRVWVMQEIACSREATLVIGNLVMPWAVMSSILDQANIPDQFHLPFGHASFERDIWDAFAAIQVIEHQRDIRNSKGSQNSSLLDVLSRFRATYSTDPRDKIYGILGLATDSLGIIPDYQKSPRDVYIVVARGELNAAKNLDLITQSLWPLGGSVVLTSSSVSSGCKTATNCDTQEIPSWLPNFSATETSKILFAQRSIFAAGTATCPEPVVVPPNGILSVTGTILDIVIAMEPVGSGSHRCRGIGFPEFARGWLPNVLKRNASAPVSYPTGGDAFEAYWRTLLTDCRAFPARRLSQRALESYTEIFNEWRTRRFVLLPEDVTERDMVDQSDKELLSRVSGVGYEADMYSLFQKWRFTELKSGLYAMVPWNRWQETENGAIVGDVVAVLRGGKVPLVLRKIVAPSNQECDGDGEKWKVVGTAYVHGFMDGLAATWTEKGLLNERTFELV